MPIAEARHESKTKLLQAAIRVIRVKGFTATRVRTVCEAAGLTKGSFFHHFDSKDELALAAADYWIEGTEARFGSASYHELADLAERFAGLCDFRKALLTGEVARLYLPGGDDGAGDLRHAPGDPRGM